MLDELSLAIDQGRLGGLTQGQGLGLAPGQGLGQDGVKSDVSFLSFLIQVTIPPPNHPTSTPNHPTFGLSVNPSTNP